MEETGKSRLEQQLAFLMEVDKMKSVSRRTMLTDLSRRETDAEHSWHIALMALLLAEYAGPEVDVNRVITLTFFIGTAVAAISGTLVGIYYQRVDTLMGNAVGLKSFAAAVLGGMGSVPGAMVGGFLIGIAETLYAAYVSSSSKDAIAFVILILILIVRPSGLFGQKSVNKV